MAKKENAPKLVYESKDSLYDRAVAAMEADKLIVNYNYKKENFIKIAEMLEEFGDYKDSVQLAQECRRQAARAEQDGLEKKYRFGVFEIKHAKTKDEWERVIAIFTELGDYKDAPKQLEACKQQMKELMRKKRTGKCIGLAVVIALAAGIAFFFNSSYWKDLKSQLFGRGNAEALTLDEKVRIIRTADIGEKVSYGAGEWYLVKRDDVSATLALAGAGDDETLRRAYNDTDEDVTWETSDLRAWLNGEFKDRMLDEEACSLLCATGALGEDNEVYGTTAGEKTEDFVCIPSAGEIEAYKEVYAKSHLDIWLMDPGNAQNTAMFRTADGSIVDYGCAAAYDGLYAMPEICVSLQ